MTAMAHNPLNFWRWLTDEISRGDMLARSSPAYLQANLLGQPKPPDAPIAEDATDSPG